MKALKLEMIDESSWKLSNRKLNDRAFADVFRWAYNDQSLRGSDKKS